MQSRVLVVVAALAAFAPSAYADARSSAKSQVEFGIKVAQNGLWKEATYRWEKAVEIDPTYAAALEQPRRSATSTKESSTRRGRRTTRR